MQLVIATWVDIVTVNSWEGKQSALDTALPVIRTVGWLLHKDEDKIVLSHGMGDPEKMEAENNPYTVLPTGCVKQLEVLRDE